MSDRDSIRRKTIVAEIDDDVWVEVYTNPPEIHLCEPDNRNLPKFIFKFQSLNSIKDFAEKIIERAKVWGIQ